MIIQEVNGLANLDDFFLAEMSDIECSNSMLKFKTICKRLGNPIADKTNRRSCNKYQIFSIDYRYLIHVC